MCGIAGVFNISQEAASIETVKKMGDAIAHRGPDGEGYFVEDNISFAHRRLAILDISDKGAQPMHSKSGNWVIIFNGCIYNYIELKQELLSKGHSFSSTSDTEVIVEGLAAYGISFFEKMDGMFAIAAWNKQEKTLHLTRDRYGIKPLYYWFNGKVIAFASEIKAILQHPDFKTELNFDALNEYFTFQNLFTFQTLFKGVYMLPPANTITINTSTREVHHKSWWDYNFTETDNTMTFEDAVDETERLFKKAVARQMVSDVPVGSYLSGGMDSGSITAIASQHVNRLSTFTCGFDMSEVSGVEANYDERRDAELMANHCKTEHFEQVINAGDLKWSLPRVVYHLEDLKVGMSYPNYYISRLASKFVKVCLQGTGGDELYGGYPWRYYRVSKSLDQKDYFEQYYNFWQRLVPDNSKSELFTPAVISKIHNLEEPRKIFERVFTFNHSLKYDSAEQHVNNSLYFEIKTFLPGLFLVGDKLSMANGLEERFPFMDNDLVAFAQKIPVKHKLGNFEKMMRVDENEFRDKKKLYTEYDDGKNVLRKAMMHFIPEKIINRKKQGFSAPDESWYRGENAAYVKELLLGENIASAEFINPAYVKKIIEEHIDHKINHRLLLWSLMCFEWWCRIFLKGEKYN
ncbi:MAG: Asparagine synthetase [Chitinophagaceae bacterium]|nr:Asparagine synthetase [Chitinophagaceae bacterium]MDB5222752.1 Asparagine synthetase [Chitinophagaceae bacterium]